MNERNVEALCRLYCDAALKISWQDINDDLQTHMQLRDAVRRVAKALASNGVLVPSALTETDLSRAHAVTELSRVHAANFHGLDTLRPMNEYERMREALERIAKGGA